MMESWKNKYDKIGSAQKATDTGDEVDLFYQLSEVDFIKVDTDAGWNKLSKKLQIKHRAHWLLTYWKVAASIAIVLAVGIVVSQLADEPAKIEYLTATSSGNNKVVSLPDGSVVTLASNSMIKYPSGESEGSRRTVLFEGEGFFEVAKDKEPFLIKTNTTTVRVLGTSFSLNTRENTELYVAEGLVSIQTKTEEQQIKKGQFAIANKTSGKIVFGKTDPNILSWKTGKFDFSDTRLGDALTYLEKYYKVEFTTSNEKLKNCKVTVKFDKESLENVVKILATILNAEGKISNKKVTFVGTSC